MSFRRPLAVVVAIAGLFFVSSAVSAQTVGLPGPDFGNVLPFEGADENPLGIGVPGEDQNVFVTAEYRLHAESKTGLIIVTADVQPPWYIYGTAQGKDGGPTKIAVSGVKLTGGFESQKEPDTLAVYIDGLEREYKTGKLKPTLLEKLKGTTTFIAPFEIPEGEELGEIVVEVDGLMCSDACLPFEKTVTAFAGEPLAKPVVAPLPPKTGYRESQSNVRIDGFIAPSQLPAGETAYLVLQTIPDPGWYVYAMDYEGDSLPARIVFDKLPTGISVGDFGPEAEKKSGKKDEKPKLHRDPMSWVIPVTVSKDLKPGNYLITGTFGYQTCRDGACQAPTGAKFTATITVSDQRDAHASRVTFEPGKYPYPQDNVAATGVNVDELVVDSSSANYSLFYVLAIAFVGGFILNFMPCVLPVLGLKVMSFANQAGEDRSRVFLLNGAYTLGLISVFMVLAVFSASVSLGLSDENLGWGQQFTFQWFNIALTAVVFVMGLSFLGVWEIPIPGFAMGTKANKLAEKEGATGAFFKGVLATVLATPCSGPGLGFAVGWTATQPVLYTFLVFLMLGLGMASPYLMLAANPALIRFLPKPGAWMETFKQVMGFVLMATVVYFLTILEWSMVVPTVGLLFVLWFACWWIGRLSYDATLKQTIFAWLQAGLVVGAIGYFCLGSSFYVGGYYIPTLADIQSRRFTKEIDNSVGDRIASANVEVEREVLPHELPWEPYSKERLDELARQNKTVLVDFTANWCQSCKFLEATVLNTQSVKNVVTEYDVVTLQADWTDKDDEMGRLLEKLGGKKLIPLLAIFPAGKPQNPIVLKDTYSKATLISKLEEAGPSKSVAAANPEKDDVSVRPNAENKLPWEPFSVDALANARAQNKPVLVHFGADWDQNQLFTKTTVLDTLDTQKVVQKNNVVTLLADVSDTDSEATEFVRDELGFKGRSPLVVVYAPGKSEPIFQAYTPTKEELASALEQAGQQARPALSMDLDR